MAVQLGARGVVILTANIVGLQQRCLAVKGDAGIAERFRQTFGGPALPVKARINLTTANHLVTLS